MNTFPIGVFDSGVGGLTAVKELNHLVPQEDIIYFGDTARVPYGTRDNKTIIEYAKQDINFLLSKNVKLIIAACGTVSSVLNKEHIKHLNVPYFGVVESTAISSVNKTKNKKIGVIGTNATIRSGSYEKAIKKIDASIEIYSKSCPLFVPLVENGHISDDDLITKMVAEKYLKEIKENNIDTLILGCTHYPIIANIIKDVMGDNVQLIEPGKEIAKTVLNYLKENDLENNSIDNGNSKYYVSDSIDGFNELAKIFLEEYAEDSVKQVKI